MKVVPVTCLYAGKPELKEKVEEAIRVHQNNDVAVAFGVAAAIILERVLLGKGMPDDDLVETFDSSPRDSWREAAKFQDLETLLLELSHEVMKGKEDSPFYDLAARSCALPGSFTAPAFLLQHDAGKDDAYVTALRANILGAGDTCSRAVFLGAVLAAADERGVPQDWVDKMDQEILNRIDIAAVKIADLVSA
jgi:ADP-ribosylglycohydrolase